MTRTLPPKSGFEPQGHYASVDRSAGFQAIDSAESEFGTHSLIAHISDRSGGTNAISSPIKAKHRAMMAAASSLSAGLASPNSEAFGPVRSHLTQGRISQLSLPDQRGFQQCSRSISVSAVSALIWVRNSPASCCRLGGKAALKKQIGCT